MVFESRADISKIWYFGNDRAKNVKSAPPTIKRAIVKLDSLNEDHH